MRASIGVVSLFLGIASMDSDSILFPAIAIFFGLALIMWSVNDEKKPKVKDYTRSHNASYPSCLCKK